MPQTPTLRVEASDGTLKHELDCITAATRQHLVEMWEGTATVDRRRWNDIYPSQVDEINDILRIERGDGSTLFAGRFGDDSQDGDTVTVTVQSFERDAQDAEPTDPREIYQNVADSDVAEDAINDIPTLIPGTLDTGASSVSFTFANAAQSKKIRDAAEPAGQEVRYNPDQTVDFVDRLGTDKPNTTISSSDQTVVDSLRVDDISRDPVTHIRGLGAQQGGEQVTASATIGSYSPGDRQVWREYVNKDIVQQDRLQQIVDRLAENANDARRRVTVETVLVDLSPELGDRYEVTLPQHDVERLLRVIRLSERITADGTRYGALLTNRNPERGGDRKRRDDLGRFNRGDQGFVDRDTDSYGWQPVTGSANATRPYPYPSDVVREDKAEVIVSSIPYRAYSQGAAAGGDHSHIVQVTHPSHAHDVTHPSHAHDVTHPSHDHDVSFGTVTSNSNTEHTAVSAAGSFLAGTMGDTGGFWDTLDTVTPPASFEFAVFNLTPTDSDNTLFLRCRDQNTNSFPAPSGILAAGNDNASSDIQGGEVTVLIPQEVDTDIDIQYETPNGGANANLNVSYIFAGDHEHDVNVGTDTSTTALGTTETSTTALGTTETSTTALGTTVDETSDASGDHVHDPQPGLVDFPTETASNVDVIVNGTTVATNINSGEFTETVDISGQLSAGGNTIEVSSDTLGLINATVETQLFRSGGPAP